MHILERYECGMYILFFRIGRFQFKWFTDCGEWFIYLIWNGKKFYRHIRISSAICDVVKSERRVTDENA